jgi:predicted small secreted protein
MPRTRHILCLLLALFALAACNTVRGIGKDVKAAGEAVEDAAD